MARAFLDVAVVGLDVDELSVAAGRRHAAHGLEHRVTFRAGDAADAADAGV